MWGIEHGKLAVEALKVIAWPTVVGGIAWYYHAELRSAFERLVRAGPTGVEFSPRPPSPQIPAPRKVR